jgi:hypothetical protein
MWFGRLILFALLAVDWAADQPVPGYVFSPALSSTEAYSVSADYREDIRKELVAGAAPAALPEPAAAPRPDDWATLSPATTPRHGHAAEFLSLDMPLLC